MRVHCSLLLLAALVAVASCVVKVPLQAHRLNDAEIVQFVPRGLHGHVAASHHSPKIAEKLRSVNMGGSVLTTVYSVPVTIGTPPVTFQVALDTGSSDLLVPLGNCDGCRYSKEPHWLPSHSSSLSNVSCSSGFHCSSCGADNQCLWQNTYETCDPAHPDEPCTVSGPMFRDQAGLGGATASQIFGGIAHQTANFVQFYIIDGVMGIAYVGLSNLGYPPLFQSLVNSNAIEHDIFSYCLNLGMSYPHSGVLTLGGVEPAVDASSVQYTPMYGSASYNVHMTGIQVATHKVDVPWFEYQETILDSGTNTVLLDTQTYNALYAGFQAECSSGKSLVGICGVAQADSLFNAKCFNMTQAQVSMFPTVTLILEGQVSMEVGPDKYLLQPNLKDHNDPAYCFYFLPTGEGGMVIIGDIIMANYVNVFDRTNQRYGVAPIKEGMCHVDA